MYYTAAQAVRVSPVADTRKTQTGLKALSRRDVLLLILINLLWGASPVAAKAALVQAPPMSLAFLRFSVAALILYGACVALHVDLRILKRDWPLFWTTGLLGLALTYLLTYAGLKQTSAADLALLQGAEPVILTILALVLLKERLFVGKAIGIGAGLLGVWLIVSHGLLFHKMGGAVYGDLVITLGLVFEALSVIVGKRLVSRYSPLTVLTYQMLTGSVLLAPCVFVVGIRNFNSYMPMFWSAKTLEGLFFLVVPCTVIAYAAWFFLLKKYDTSDLTGFLFLQPVFGALLGVMLQHDQMRPKEIIGAVLVLVGITIIQRWRQSAAQPRQEPIRLTIRHF